MKSILEQDFDELYAQVEERVKCIQPVKQMDTFTKTLMWTSLNEILTDVFGGSRFMWMIGSTDTEFVVTFVDRYRLKETKKLYVKHTTVFVWPEKQTVRNMTIDELTSFTKLCNDYGINQTDISHHYSEGKTWFNGLLVKRKKGVCPIDEYTFERRSEDMRTALGTRTAKWSTSKIKLFKIMYVLNEFKLPIPVTLIQEVFGSEVDKSQIHSLYASFGKQRGHLCATEQYINKYTVIEVYDDVIKYIDHICEWFLLLATNDNKQQINQTVKSVLTRVVGIRKQVVFRDGRTQRVCPEHEISKIISFVEQLRASKADILMTANKAYDLKDIHPTNKSKEVEND